MRWMVTGSGGQLGSHLVSLLVDTGVVALSRDDLDISSGAAVNAAIRDVRPDLIVNAAAYTSVDAAETDEATAFAVNADGPRLLASALASHGGRLIHVSTDYVFEGRATRPYEPGDATEPRTAYGRSKLAGERAVLSALPTTSHVVRTAWVYGGPSPNFVDTMVSLQRSRETVEVVADQVGSPTWVDDLAHALVALGSSPGASGVLHYVNAGRASWYELAQEVFRLVGADPERVRPVGTAAFLRPAQRPAWSVLSTRSWIDRGFPVPRDWRAALADCLSQRSA